MEALVKGDVAMAAGQISEILAVPGVELVGPLPKEIQLKTVYSVGLSARSSNSEAATALLEAMFSPESKAALKESGLDLP
jgi:molybdate transport system substrate-binding protein